MPTSAPPRALAVLSSLAVSLPEGDPSHAQGRRADAVEPAPNLDTPGVRQKPLLQAPLTRIPGKQATIFLGEFEPGASTPLHRHPGTEMLFVLEGRGRMEIAGRDSQPLESGNLVLVEPDPGVAWFSHRVVNEDEEAALHTLVIVIHDEGTPPALPALPAE